MLAPGFKTPRVVHMSAGIERQMGERSVFSVNYVRELGTRSRSALTLITSAIPPSSPTVTVSM